MKALLLVLVALGLAACGGGGTPEGPLTVEEALAADADGPLEIRGLLYVVEGEPVLLCAAILESYPPQCGRPALEVAGLDLGTMDGLTTEGRVSWAEGVVLRGAIASGVLTVVEADPL